LPAKVEELLQATAGLTQGPLEGKAKELLSKVMMQMAAWPGIE